MSDVRPLTSELQEAARKQLGEEKFRTDADLAHIKEWLQKQPHITPRIDDQLLIGFLRGCKFSLERTKEKLDNHYTMKTALPEYFANKDPMSPELQEMLRLGVLLPLPHPDADGRRVILQRVGLYDPSKYHVQDLFKLTILVGDILLKEDDHLIVNGFVFLMDMAGVTLGHAMQMQPTLLKKTMTCFQDGFPLRLKGLNFVNYPPTFDTFLNIFRPLLKEKIRKRIILHESLESVYDKIPHKILPKEYGGSGPSTEELAAEWKKKVESYRDYYLEDAKYTCDEKKRPGKPKTHEDLFGLEGSFRQLSVD